jgi:hypothetical protein
MTRTLVTFARHQALATGLFALLGLPSPAQASEDWTTVAPTCVPDSAQTLDFGLTSKTGGYVRAGRNPPVLYFCPIHHADNLNSNGQPSWNRFSLQYLDTNTRGGNVIARLYRKHRVTGAVSQVTSLSSVGGPGIQVVSKIIKPQNLKDYALYATFEMVLEASETAVETHMLMLTTQ